MFHFHAASDMPLRGASADCHVVRLPAGIRGTGALLAALGEGLRFPDYYGANFDAFWDCARTLDGIAARRVLVVHPDLPALPGDDLERYIELLRDVAHYWTRRADRRRFEAWFPRTARKAVMALLLSCPPPSAE